MPWDHQPQAWGGTTLTDINPYYPTTTPSCRMPWDQQRQAFGALPPVVTNNPFGLPWTPSGSPATPVWTPSSSPTSPFQFTPAPSDPTTVYDGRVMSITARPEYSDKSFEEWR